MNKILLSGFADEIDPDVNKQIELLNKLNIKFLELRSAYGKNVSALTLDEANKLKQLLDTHHIGVSCIGSPIGKIPITDDFEPHLELLKHIIKIAKIFNTSFIRIFSFYMPKDSDYTIYHDEVMTRMERMIQVAKEEDVILLHENEKGIYGDDANRCLELMKRNYSKNFKCIFDFANFVQCMQDTKSAYQLLEPYISYLHIKDALMEDDTIVLPGKGDGHIKEIIIDMLEKGYQGFFSLEPHLVDFMGLQNLEHDVKQRGRNDGAAAFESAYIAFNQLLN